MRNLSLAVLSVTLMAAAGAAEARWLSVDPVKANANNGQSFNRYWYANNNPYKYTDPDGRVAVITYKSDGSISIQVPMSFTGSHATPENISSIKAGASAAYSGTYDIGGTATKIDFQVVDITSTTPAAAHNSAELIGVPTSHSTGRSFVNEVGGTSGEINMNSKGIAYGEASHEMGHYAGAQDHYDYGTGLVDPAYSGNLMGQLPGTIDNRNINEMLGNSKNIIVREPPPPPEKPL